jgi:hypothetical protein
MTKTLVLVAVVVLFIIVSSPTGLGMTRHTKTIAGRKDLGVQNLVVGFTFLWRRGRCRSRHACSESGAR